MIKRDNILKELTELNSNLGTVTSQNVYVVPEGYFEGLAANVIARIKAIKAVNAAEELSLISPFLSGLSKKIPYSVPGDYFNSIQKNNQFPVTETDKLSAKDELEMLSPLLSNMSKEIPFTVPQDYFETLTDRTETKKPVAKVVSLFKESWFRYAAAAVVAGIVILAGFLILNTDNVNVNTDSYAWVKKNIKKVSTEKLNEFVQMAEQEKLIQESFVSSDNKIKEVKDLIKDIPESEIQSLLDDTKLLDDDADTDNESAAGKETMLN
jgi:hypothetical protein